MNRIIVLISLLVFSPFMILGQKSIQSSDVEIHTQLTFLRVPQKDVVAFEKGMGELSKLSKKVKLGENYDWLTYTSDTGQYLIINFSTGLDDVLTIESYRNAFHKKGASKPFDTILNSILQLDILVERNYLKQMLLPWSTVREISVSEFPLATMVEYQIPTKNIEAYDSTMRQLVALLKKVEYPYPLESNRGSLGAYGVMTLVWFYDDRNDYFGKNSLLNWMEKHGDKKELLSILNAFKNISESTRTYNFRYKKLLSY